MSYHIEVHITGPGCNLDFTHQSASEELASAIKQCISIISTGSVAPIDRPMGTRVKAGAFDRPSQVFVRQTKAYAGRPLPTEIVQAPKVSDYGSARSAIFEGDEDIEDGDTELGGEQLGQYRY